MGITVDSYAYEVIRGNDDGEPELPGTCFWARCPATGDFSHGATVREALDGCRACVQFRIEHYTEHGVKIPKPIKVSSRAYNPDWVSPPGDTLREYLEVKNMSQGQLAKRMRVPVGQVNRLINARIQLSPQFALGLAYVFRRPPAQFWMNLEINYRVGLAKQAYRKKRSKHV